MKSKLFGLLLFYCCPSNSQELFNSFFDEFLNPYHEFWTTGGQSAYEEVRLDSVTKTSFYDFQGHRYVDSSTMKINYQDNMVKNIELFYHKPSIFQHRGLNLDHNHTLCETTIDYYDTARGESKDFVLIYQDNRIKEISYVIDRATSSTRGKIEYYYKENNLIDYIDNNYHVHIPTSISSNHYEQVVYEYETNSTNKLSEKTFHSGRLHINKEYKYAGDKLAGVLVEPNNENSYIEVYEYYAQDSAKITTVDKSSEEIIKERYFINNEKGFISKVWNDTMNITYHYSPIEGRPDSVCNLSTQVAETKSDYSIYPNPTESHIIVESSIGKPFLELTLFDLSGQKLFTKELKILTQ